MNKNIKYRNSMILALTSLIWGASFVAQSAGGKAVGAFTFNGIRSLIGMLVLIPIIKLFDHINPDNKRPANTEERSVLIRAGVLSGLSLFTATTLQQIALCMGAEAGKSGFLTATYILMVPILGLFLRRKCGANVWVAILIALVGLYFLCFKGSLSFKLTDILLLSCALFFSIQILVIDHYSPVVDGVRMSCIQFLVVGILSIPFMIGMEMGVTAESIGKWAEGFESSTAIIALLYAGVFVCGVAYTLQIIGQNGLNPAIASLIMSLESVFSVLAGWVLLHERLSHRELFGCVLIFIAIILAQVEFKGKKKA